LEPSALLVFMRQHPGWDVAIANLRVLIEEHEGQLESLVGYVARYEGARAAMVFDVVSSPRHRYEQVRPRVAQFMGGFPALTLQQMADGEGPSNGLGLSTERWETVKKVAKGFGRYRQIRPDLSHASDDELVADWAAKTEPARLTPNLDPYVGVVKGIGIASFAYLRMRSGVDALKPDSRVRSRFAQLGFPTPQDDAALLLVGDAAAEEAGISRFALDQHLWWRRQ
jgi:hypothetical protein